jgi:hypothetical protein
MKPNEHPGTHKTCPNLFHCPLTGLAEQCSYLKAGKSANKSEIRQACFSKGESDAIKEVTLPGRVNPPGHQALR